LLFLLFVVERKYHRIEREIKTFVHSRF